jgi:uncharacterized protein
MCARCLTLALLAMSLVAPVSAQSLQPVPKLTVRVTDFTGTLTAEQQSSLDDKLATFEARKGLRMAVLVVATTEPEDIEQYSIRVVHQWKLGRHVDEGAMLIVAKSDRELWFEGGKAVGAALPEVATQRIISETIVPLFRQGEFYGGINAGLDQMIRVIDGEPLPAPDFAWQGSSARGVSHLVPFLVVAVLFGSAVLRALLGRGLGAVVAGAATGAVVFFVGQALFIALVAGLIAFLFALISGFSGGGTWSSYPRTGGWGGGLGGADASAGGGFNGGGASGRW